MKHVVAVILLLAGSGLIHAQCSPGCRGMQAGGTGTWAYIYFVDNPNPPPPPPVPQPTYHYSGQYQQPAVYGAPIYDVPVGAPVECRSLTVEPRGLFGRRAAVREEHYYAAPPAATYSAPPSYPGPYTMPGASYSQPVPLPSGPIYRQGTPGGCPNGNCPLTR